MICKSTNIELEVVINRINKKDINLQPDYQRGEVWTEAKKKKLIDTILRGWMIPPIHVIPSDEFVDEVLDGQQRLVAIRDFFNGVYAIDGNTQPYDEKIHGLDKLYFKDLSDEVKRRLFHYSITFISLSEFNPNEPAELFNRLNQPSTLTAAEKRNAYIGKTRNQIKELVKEFESLGVNKDLIGFSNSRLAYDEIISKFAYIVEVNSLKKKVTAGDISKKYQDNEVYSEETIMAVRDTLNMFVTAMIAINRNHLFQPKMSKATILSWFIFLLRKPEITEEQLSELIFYFESSREFLKNKLVDNITEIYSNHITAIHERNPYFESMLNIYNQRASIGSTDALAVIYRDIITQMYYYMLYDSENELLKIANREYLNTKNINAVLENVNLHYDWGRNIR